MAAPSATQRRLAAILAADVVGYSRLMEAAEATTLARLKAHRAELIDPALAAHGGRLIKLMGDGALVEFPSVVEAVACAIEIQQGMLQREADQGEALAIRFRIGINLGDVLIDGDDLYGDGVNIASRLEALAEPGGITISGAAFEQVSGKLPVAFRDLGAHSLKNIARPVRVFAVQPGDGSPGKARQRPQLSRRMMALAAIAALGGLTGLAFWLEQSPDDHAVRPPVNERAAVAVIPFTNLAGADEAYFSNGLTEDVAGALARFGDLAVIDPAVLPHTSNGESDGTQTWRELGVRYVVRGTVRRDGDRLRVTAQLADAPAGTIRWSQRYDTALADVFSVQDDITRQLAGAMAVRLDQLEQQRVASKAPDSLEVYDLVLRGRALTSEGTRAANLEARAVLKQAVEKDPAYAPANEALGWALLDYAINGWTEFRDEAVAEAERAGHAALAADADFAGAHAVLGNVYLTRKQYDLAVAELNKALLANPSDARSYETLSDILVWSGDAEGAIASLEAAQRLDPTLTLGTLGIAYYFLGRYGDALTILVRESPREPAPLAQARDLVFLAAAYAQLGNPQGAERAKTALAKVAPFFEPELFISQYRSETDRARLRDGLTKAGIAH